MAKLIANLGGVCRVCVFARRGSRSRSTVTGRAVPGFVEEIRELVARCRVAVRVAVEQALVGAGRGLLTEAGRLARGSHFRGSQPERRKLSQLFARHHIDPVDFLKCGIEGSEFELFGDCEERLPKVCRIAMEVHCAIGSAADLARFFERQGSDVMLQDNPGWRVRRLDDTGYLFATR